MAIRKIVLYGEDSLREPSKEVHKISKKVQELVRDLLDTLYTQNGVGLAAPQIGVNERIFVVDTSSGSQPLNPIVFINPKIIKKSGAMVSNEGCLSFPQVFTDVKRYSYVMIKALDRHGKPFVLEAKDGSLLCKAIQHEYDHLDGILFIDHIVNRFDVDKSLAEHNLPPIEPDKILDDSEIEEGLRENSLKAKGV